MEKVSPHLSVYHGPTEVGILHWEDRAVLFECDPGVENPWLKELGVRRVEAVCITHYHRDQYVGAAAWRRRGARIVAPEAERMWIETPEKFWGNPRYRWHLYDYHPQELVPIDGLPVDDPVKPRARRTWGPARVQVIATPGHTDGSVSYLVDVDGRRVVFVGDLITGDGQLVDVHSLQKSTERHDYHGFLGARGELESSLASLARRKPDVFVPSHGAVITDPAGAIARLRDRLQRLYDNYGSTSALRHYFPDSFAPYLVEGAGMPFAPTAAAPRRLSKAGTSWILRSDDGHALVMDCGNQNVIVKVRQMLRRGTISSVDALWITHYHDDHVNAVPQFVAEFGCPVETTASVAQVISQPLAWRLPCISEAVCPVDRVRGDGEQWTWRGMKLTAFEFPGQTLYHSGLLVDDGRRRMLFCGDSFTMAGMDDYCAGNRNILRPRRGFLRCLDIIEKLEPDLIFNCHVASPWHFEPSHIDYMRSALERRIELLRELLPWDDVNYGLDNLWLRCSPYEQRSRRGGRFRIRVVATNHSRERRAMRARLVFPRAMDGDVSEWKSRWVAPGKEGGVVFTYNLTDDSPVGRHVIAADVIYGGRWRPLAAEAVLQIEE